MEGATALHWQQREDGRLILRRDQQEGAVPEKAGDFVAVARDVGSISPRDVFVGTILRRSPSRDV
jgi:hypothetical protein